MGIISGVMLVTELVAIVARRAQQHGDEGFESFGREAIKRVSAAAEETAEETAERLGRLKLEF